MNRKYATIGLITSVILIGSTVTFAADSTSNTSLEGGMPTTTAQPATTAPTPATSEPATATTPAPVTTEPAATTAPAPATTEPTATTAPAPATTEPTATTAPAPVTTEPTATTAPAPVTTEPAAETVKVDSTKKALSKVTCEDFLAFDEVIQPKYVIAAEPYAKNAKAKTVIIDVVATETLVPVLIEECTKTPKVSFLSKLKSTLKH